MTVLEAYPWVRERFSEVREHKCGSEASAACSLKCHRHARTSFALGEGNRLLLKCWAGCNSLEALRAVGCGWRDCFPDRAVPDNVRRTETCYPYHDETGRAVLYQSVRLEPGYRGKDKAFFRRRPRPGGGWINTLDDVRRVLYRLPELLRADPEEPVYVVAGEKDADTLRQLRLLATTNIGGESARWEDGYSATLAGRDVIVIEDRDSAGRRHADEVCGSLMLHARSLRRGALPAKDVTAFYWSLRRNDVAPVADLRAYVEGVVEEWSKWSAQGVAT